MSGCCTPKGYRQIFSEKNARKEAKRYRRKGLDGTSRRIADLSRERVVEGKTLLQFRVFLHPPELILAAVEQHGFRTGLNDRGLLWQVTAFERIGAVARTPARAGSTALL